MLRGFCLFETGIELSIVILLKFHYFKIPITYFNIIKMLYSRIIVGSYNNVKSTKK